MPGGGSDQRQSGWPSRAVTDGAGGHEGVRAQDPLGWQRNLCPRRRKQRGANMIVVARVVVIRPGNVMRMAMFGMIGAVIGLGGHGAGAMFDGLNGGSDGQRQGKTQGRPKRPDPLPSLTSCLHHCPWRFTPASLLASSPLGG